MWVPQLPDDFMVKQESATVALYDCNHTGPSSGPDSCPECGQGIHRRWVRRDDPVLVARLKYGSG